MLLRSVDQLGDEIAEALRAPRGRHRAPPRSHPRVRYSRRLEQRLPLVRLLARLARGDSTWARHASASVWRGRWEKLPKLAQALARGGDSPTPRSEPLTRVATPETEERLLAIGRAGTAEHVERIVRGWRCVDRQAEARETAARHARQGRCMCIQTQTVP